MEKRKLLGTILYAFEYNEKEERVYF